MSHLFSRVTLANEISEYSGSKKVISSLFTNSKKVLNDTIDIKGIFTESISKDCNALLKSKMSWNYQNIEYVVNAMLECKGTIFTTGIGKTNGTLSFHKFKRIFHKFNRIFLRRMITWLTQIINYSNIC